MKTLNLLFVVALSMALFSCQNGSTASNSDPRIKGQKQGGNVCEPESQIMSGNLAGKFAGNIVSGEVVKKGDPDDKSAVMLLSENSLCTAVPIGPNILLTAAHCVGDDPTKLIAAFYPSLSCESGFDITKNSIRVIKIARNNGYNMDLGVDQRTDDIALVFLKSNISTTY